MTTKKTLKCVCAKQGCWRGDRGKIPAYCEANNYLDELGKSNIFVKAIRPPTVPAGTARLRISVTLAHDKKILEQCAVAMRDTAQQLGIL